MKKLLFLLLLIPLLPKAQDTNTDPTYHRCVTIKISRCYKTVVPKWNRGEYLHRYNNPDKQSADTTTIDYEYYETFSTAWIVQGIDEEKKVFFSEIIRDTTLNFKVGELRKFVWFAGLPKEERYIPVTTFKGFQ